MNRTNEDHENRETIEQKRDRLEKEFHQAVEAAGGREAWERQELERRYSESKASPSQRSLDLVYDHLRPQLLYEWWFEDAISQAQLREWLPGVWQKCDYPAYSPLGCLDECLWLQLFLECGFISDDSKLQAPTEDLIVYRGSTLDNIHGMSWTTCLTTAKFFAEVYYPERFGRNAEETRVFTATVPPQSILARFSGRDESEVIGRPWYLGNDAPKSPKEKEKNRITIIGNLGRDPEMKYTPGGPGEWMPTSEVTVFATPGLSLEFKNGAVGHSRCTSPSINAWRDLSQKCPDMRNQMKL